MEFREELRITDLWMGNDVERFSFKSKRKVDTDIFFFERDIIFNCVQASKIFRFELELFDDAFRISKATTEAIQKPIFEGVLVYFLVESIAQSLEESRIESFTECW